MVDKVYTGVQINCQHYRVCSGCGDEGIFYTNICEDCNYPIVDYDELPSNFFD